MAVQLSAYVVDRYIAPDVSKFTQANIPDMSKFDPESGHWLANFFLNSLVRGEYPAPIASYMYNYFRRAEAAFREHVEARRSTLHFLDGKQSPTRYAMALHHWEIFLGQTWHSFKILEKCFKFVIFVKDSGSVEERLNHFYNAMKHVESRIECGQILTGATVPVWLTNDGLRSTETALTYGETGELLREVAKWASIFSDPQTALEKWRELDA
jgi:hypothetical protein